VKPSDTDPVVLRVVGVAVQPDRVVGRPAALGPGAAHPRPYQGETSSDVHNQSYGLISVADP
jgi:hypothetical protein